MKKSFSFVTLNECCNNFVKFSPDGLECFSPNTDFLIKGFTFRMRRNFVFYLHHFEMKTLEKAENKNCIGRSKVRVSIETTYKS